MSVRIITGDCLPMLRTLPDACFDCVATSPPYWGLRSYLADASPLKRHEIGLEPTLGEHLDVLVEVFREVRRTLKVHGTLWLNYGDCYAAGPNGKAAAEYRADGSDDRTFRDKPFSTVGPIYQSNSPIGGQRGDPKRLAVGAGITNGRVVAGGYLKPKDLCMIANRLAIALQEDGWYVRSEIIWHKPNPMPESVYDRPTTAHEKVWLLTRSEEYFYNHEAIREECVSGPSDIKKMRESKERIGGKHKTLVDPLSKASSATNIGRKRSVGSADGRNARNVWTIAPRAFRGAHFATFPPALAERCIKAGCPPTVCGACGAVGACGGLCGQFARIPGRVLDPFGGSGTVGMVAEQLGLDCTLIELNPESVAMAHRRIAGEPEPQAAE